MLIDHITLRTADLEGTREFLSAVFDLKAGYRPAFAFPGYWLYHDGQPIIHLVPGMGEPMPASAEAIDHAGFKLQDYNGMRLKLDTLEISYQLMDIAELGERRIFIQTPGGIVLELVFLSEDRSGIAAGITSDCATECDV